MNKFISKFKEVIWSYFADSRQQKEVKSVLKKGEK